MTPDAPDHLEQRVGQLVREAIAKIPPAPCQHLFIVATQVDYSVRPHSLIDFFDLGEVPCVRCGQKAAFKASWATPPRRP